MGPRFQPPDNYKRVTPGVVPGTRETLPVKFGLKTRPIFDPLARATAELPGMRSREITYLFSACKCFVRQDLKSGIFWETR